MISEELLIRKNATKEQVFIYYPESSEEINRILDSIIDEETLIRELDKLDALIKKEREHYTNAPYATEEGETYYADVEEDERIYDPIIPEEQAIIEEALETSTEKYLEVDPKEIHDSKEYSNFINVDIIYDNQIGYRVIENENGLFHGIQKESSRFIYPSRKLNLNDPKNIEICNELFETTNKRSFTLGDEIELDGINPAEIFMPFVAVVDDPTNQVTYADVLIGEGITVDSSFKNRKIKEPLKPDIPNKIIKGLVTLKTLTKEGAGFKEDLILEPTKYIEGTFIPYPRDKKDTESLVDYELF